MSLKKRFFARPMASGLRLAPVVLTLSAASAHANGPALRLPLDCEPGKTCWIANYTDLDAGPAAADYRCGPLTYDGHKGTDFALRDLAAMRAGVTVRAAADGVAVGVRDGEPDLSIRDTGAQASIGRECGNGVRIDHGNGWSTQYCHLRRGSVAVRHGDRIVAGQPLGQVGLSGNTEFPHLHLTVAHDGKPVDPFSGRSSGDGCGMPGTPLWVAEARDRLPYARRQVYNLGLAGETPEVARVRDGTYSRRPVHTSAPVLAIWVEAFGASAGDKITLVLEGPDGATLVRSNTRVERDLIRIFRWAGKRSRGAWLPGTYRLTAEILPPTARACHGRRRALK
jgi:hypothetical protein